MWGHWVDTPSLEPYFCGWRWQESLPFSWLEVTGWRRACPRPFPCLALPPQVQCTSRGANGPGRASPTAGNRGWTQVVREQLEPGNIAVTDHGRFHYSIATEVPQLYTLCLRSPIIAGLLWLMYGQMLAFLSRIMTTATTTYTNLMKAPGGQQRPNPNQQQSA